MQICISSQRQPCQHPLLSFAGRIPFLPPNQQRQSTEGNIKHNCRRISANHFRSKTKFPLQSRKMREMPITLVHSRQMIPATTGTHSQHSRCNTFITPAKSTTVKSNGLTSVCLILFTRDSVAIARICYGNSVCLSVRPSVCLSVRLSHGWISQKRLKLGSRNFHHTVAPSL